MPRRPLRTVPTVIVPGWNGSGPGHWQTWLEDESAAVGRPTLRPAFDDVDRPDLAGWLAALRAAVQALPETGYDVVAHSLGAVLWLHHVAQANDAPRPDRVLLVAPPSPALDEPRIAEFLPPPTDVDVVRHSAEGTVLVGGEGDPFCPEGTAAAYGVPLRIAVTVVEGGGHLNPQWGFGPWPAVLAWCGRDNLAFY